MGSIDGTDESAERADHVENSGNISLIEGMHANPGADEGRDDLGLQIGKAENEIGLEREYFWNVGGDEGRDARLLFARLRRPDGVAGNADDTVLLAQQIERLGRFLSEAYDALGWIHARIIPRRGEGPGYLHRFARSSRAVAAGTM